MAGGLRAELRTPSLLIERSALEANLAEMAKLTAEHGVELVPHAKTHRMAELGQRQLDHGAAGLCVAKLGEAEAFADAGVSRLFIAYPIAGVGVAARALALDRRVDLAIGTDGVDAASALGSAFDADGRVARVMLAIDTGLGREGVAFDSAVDAARAIHALAGVELVGIFTHEGSVYAAPDDEALKRAAREIAERMVEAARLIRASGVPLPIVSLGSSSSVRAVVGVPGVTQVRPGIYAVNDLGQIALGTATLDSTALRIVTTVVSHAEPGRVCIDAGSKALGADLLPATAHRDRYPGYGLVLGAPGWIIERLSEEHGWLRWNGAEGPPPLPVGTRLEIVPNHACVAFAALRRAVLVDGETVIAEWDGFGPGTSS